MHVVSARSIKIRASSTLKISRQQRSERVRSASHAPTRHYRVCQKEVRSIQLDLLQMACGHSNVSQASRDDI